MERDPGKTRPSAEAATASTEGRGACTPTTEAPALATRSHRESPRPSPAAPVRPDRTPQLAPLPRPGRPTAQATEQHRTPARGPHPRIEPIRLELGPASTHLAH